MLARWKHPLTLLFGISASLVCLTMMFRIVGGLSNSIQINFYGLKTDSFIALDWPYVISGFIWLTGFSIGIIGLVTNTINFFRCGFNSEPDFSLLQNLGKEEQAELTKWLRDKTFEPSHLKELWGESRDRPS